ncbi:TPA: IS630 family transposase [Escherichia coli]|jgi:transposase|uniref:IS630 family transposase n=27 Tax=Enterobacterales TaxID=91347 RepID=A0A7I0L3S9_ECO25|nr:MULTISPECIES: IS630-like element ISEc40 family transposase [Enterobacteriaceae]EEZ5709365.1 IS630 family transposase [Escherichia coli O25]EFA4963733.1 IS630 family transposase [Escherichia coli O2]HAX0049237.1 IS630 family transposase [Escherichia coli JJ2591]HAX0103009.1 IS630 family transposase [Escherichia coli U054]HAX0121787.1 IS630 family transposase [Escherichia coli MVAST167]HAX0159427.1 IS630 family transposase [Escherichia coli QU090]HAX0204344.1 IS630 family transposase [Esche
MLSNMKIFITEQQKAELERLHDSSRDGRVRDRIKAILLASEGWSSAMIAQALRLHQTTIDHHISEFLNKGKLKPENGGSDSKLSAEQTAFLISQLSDNLFHHTRDVIAFVTRTWNIIFSIPGMNKWLHRNGFTYKKPSGVPHKLSEEKQRQFIEYYKELKTTVGDEPILFIDGVHPTQATKISYGWIRKGQKKAVKTTGSRTRLNIMGALNLKALTSPLICEYKTINEYNVSLFLNEIRKVYPDYNQKIHVILDGAGYHRSQLVKDWAEVVNIRLHYLPPYSPNLNPIERMWKLMNEHARNNRYFSSTREFREAISVFFNQTLPDIADSLTSRINDHFQVLTPAS